MAQDAEENERWDSRKGARHLYYEIWMLYENAAWLSSSTAAPEPPGTLRRRVSQPEYNARLESFVLHLRALYYFFYESRRKNDIIADDFMRNGGREERWKGPGEEQGALKTAQERAHKELAHLTYERIGKTLPEKQWDFIRLHGRIWKVVEDFLEDADDEKLGDVAADLRELQARVTPSGPGSVGASSPSGSKPGKPVWGSLPLHSLAANTGRLDKAIRSVEKVSEPDITARSTGNTASETQYGPQEGSDE